MFWYNAGMSTGPPLGRVLERLWQRILKALGLTTLDKRTYTFESDLVNTLEDLAEREQRSEEEIVADLLSFALAQHDAVEAYMHRWQELSPREQQVAALTCLNYTNRQMAQRLQISPETVKTHVRNMLRKFGLRSKNQLRKALADWDFSSWEEAEL
jgi:DNA-binding CsgD family transcriptional regulator